MNFRKKFFLVVSLIVILMIGTVMAVIFTQRGKTYKQNLFPSTGVLNIIGNESFDLPLIFVDENEKSEFSSAKNIKNIAINSDKGKISVDSFKMNIIGVEKKYTLRNIQTVCKTDLKGKIKLEDVTIELVNGKTKKYNVGNLILNVEDKSTRLDNTYADVNITTQFINKNSVVESDGKTVYPSTPLGVVIGLELGDDMVINGISINNPQYDFSTSSMAIQLSDKEYDDYDTMTEFGKASYKAEGVVFDNKKEVNIKYSKNKKSLFIYLPLKKKGDITSMDYFDLSFDITVNGEKRKVYSNLPFVDKIDIMDTYPIINFLKEGK